MSSTVYEVGQTVRLTATFQVSGVSTDPGSVTFQTRDPNGTQTNYTTSSGVVHDSAGVYHLDVSPTIAGAWGYRVVGTAPVATAHEDSFNVRATLFV